ncbi:hypothetical protein SOVF_138690, partial [Spinacia oleracea]
NDEGIGSDDDDPADVIVAEVLADEAKEQPYFTDDATDVHRKEGLPPLNTLPRTTKILTTWRELIIKKNHVVHGGVFLGLPAEYKLVVPPEGTKTLDRELLGFDENWRPVCTQPPQPKAKYDTISTYSTRASSRRSTTTVAKNRVSAACKSKSSSVVVSKAPPSSTMQSNPTGRGGTRRKRS